MSDLVRRLIRFVDSRIAVKLTLTLVGFVAVASLAAGLYLSQALDRFAAESLEARLATSGRLLHDDVRALLRRRAGAACARRRGAGGRPWPAAPPATRRRTGRAPARGTGRRPARRWRRSRRA